MAQRKRPADDVVLLSDILYAPTATESAGDRNLETPAAQELNIITNGKRPRLDQEGESSDGKCTGFKLDTENIYTKFPFQLFELKNLVNEFVVENGVFHATTCAKKNYSSENGKRKRKHALNE